MGWLLAGALVIHNRAMEEVRFYYHRGKAANLAVAGIAFLFLGVANVMMSFSPSTFPPPIRALLGVVVVLLSFYSLGAAWIKLSQKDAVLKVNSEGLTDNDPVDGRGFVPWSQVQKMETFEGGAFKLILNPSASENPPGILGSLRGQILRHRQIRIYTKEIKDNAIDKADQVRAIMTAAHAA